MFTLQQTQSSTTDSNTVETRCTASVVSLAESQLRRSGHLPLSNIGCEFHQGVLILTGRLTTYYLKQMAQTAVVGLEEVEEIVNRIEVLGPTEWRRTHVVSDDVGAGNRFPLSAQIKSVLHKDE